jgi:hypothetical protein
MSRSRLVSLTAKLQVVWALGVWVLLFLATLASNGPWPWAIVPGLPVVAVIFAATFPVTLFGCWLLDVSARSSRAAAALAVLAFVAAWDLIGGPLVGGAPGNVLSAPGLIFAAAASTYAATFIWLGPRRRAVSSDIAAP